MSLADHGINYHLSLTLLVITVELKHSRLAFLNDWNTVLILLNYLSLKIYPVTALKFSYHLSFNAFDMCEQRFFKLAIMIPRYI